MTSPNDKQTARGLDLQLDTLTHDEIAMLVFVVETLLKGELVRSLGGDEPVLERIALKLKAHRAGSAEPTEGA